MEKTDVVRIALAEDAPECAKQLMDCLHQYEKLHNAAFQISLYENGMELLEMFHGDLDVIFLDIDMPGMNGMDTAREIRTMDREVMIIFVTNLAQYAIQGYSVGAFDYILKPLRYYELDMKLQLVMHQLSSRQKKTILIKQDGDLHWISVKKILYIEINSHKIRYYTRQGVFESSTGQTLKCLEEELQPYGFVRCNKGTLVNAHCVDSLRGDELVVDGTRLPLSRSHRKTTVQMLLALAKGDMNG